MATAILILNYNTASDTVACIQSIEAYNSAPINYIVVDNGSSDRDGIGLLDEFFKQSGKSYSKMSDTDTPASPLPYFSFLVSQDNDGYARGNNKGLRIAFSDPGIKNILIINSDILFTEDMIPALIHILDIKPDCGFVTPLVISRWGTVDHTCARKAPTNWEVILLFLMMRKKWFNILSKIDARQKILRERPELLEQPVFPVDTPSGACMLIEKDLMERIGGFDPNTFLYYEENILFKKLNAVSKNSYCTPIVRCTHLGAGSTQQLSTVFLKRCNLNSADYYLSNYGNMSFFQRVAWKTAKVLWNAKLRASRSK
ncbi:MAG: glycosyltransferase [Bacteroidales bacterium]|nr:glycosyltransferase [Bacteroidales bacterium]